MTMDQGTRSSSNDAAAPAPLLDVAASTGVAFSSRTAAAAPVFRLVAEAQRRVEAAAATAAEDVLQCLSAGVQQQQQPQPQEQQPLQQQQVEATARKDVDYVFRWHTAAAAGDAAPREHQREQDSHARAAAKAAAAVRTPGAPLSLVDVWQQPPLFPVYIHLKTLTRGFLPTALVAALQQEAAAIGVQLLPQLQQVCLFQGSTAYLLPLAPAAGDAAEPSVLRLKAGAPVVAACCCLRRAQQQQEPMEAGQQQQQQLLLLLLTTQSVAFFAVVLLRQQQQRRHRGIIDYGAGGCCPLLLPAAAGQQPQNSSTSKSCNVVQQQLWMAQLVALEDLSVDLPTDIRYLLQQQQQQREEQQQQLYRSPWYPVPRFFAQQQQQQQDGSSTMYACIGGQILQISINANATRSYVRRLPLRLSSSCSTTCCCDPTSNSSSSKSNSNSSYSNSVGSGDLGDSCPRCAAAAAAAVQRLQRHSGAAAAAAAAATGSCPGVVFVQEAGERLLAAADDAGGVYLLRLDSRREGRLFSRIAKGFAALFRLPHITALGTSGTMSVEEAAAGAPAAAAESGSCQSQMEGEDACDCPLCCKQPDTAPVTPATETGATEARDASEVTEEERDSSGPPAGAECVAYISPNCWQQQLLQEQQQQDQLTVADLCCSFTPDGCPLLTLVTSRGDRVMLLANRSQKVVVAAAGSSSSSRNGCSLVRGSYSLRVLSVLLSPEAAHYREMGSEPINSSRSNCNKSSRCSALVRGSSRWPLHDLQQQQQQHDQPQGGQQHQQQPAVTVCNNGLFVFSEGSSMQEEQQQQQTATTNRQSVLLSLRSSWPSDAPVKAAEAGSYPSAVAAAVASVQQPMHLHCCCRLSLRSPLLAAAEDRLLWWPLQQPQLSSNNTNSSLRQLLGGCTEGLPEFLVAPAGGISEGAGKDVQAATAAAATPGSSSRRLWLFTPTEFLLVDVSTRSSSSSSVCCRVVGAAAAKRGAAALRAHCTAAKTVRQQLLQQQQRSVLGRLQMEADAAAAATEAAVAAIECRREFPLLPPAAPQTRWGCLQLLVSLQVDNNNSDCSNVLQGRNLPRLTLIADAADSNGSNSSEQLQQQPQWIGALEMRLALLVGRLWGTPLYSSTKQQQQPQQQQQQQEGTTVTASTPTPATMPVCRLPLPYLEWLCAQLDLLLQQLLLLVGPRASTVSASLVHALAASHHPPWTYHRSSGGSNGSGDEKADGVFMLKLLVGCIDSLGNLQRLLEAAPGGQPYRLQLLRLLGFVLLLLLLEQQLRLIAAIERLPRSSRAFIWQHADGLWRGTAAAGASVSATADAAGIPSQLMCTRTLAQILQCSRIQKRLWRCLSTALLMVHHQSSPSLLQQGGQSLQSSPAAAIRSNRNDSEASSFLGLRWALGAADTRALFCWEAQAYMLQPQQQGTSSGLLQLADAVLSRFAGCAAEQRRQLMTECLLQLLLQQQDDSFSAVRLAVQQLMTAAAVPPAATLGRPTSRVRSLPSSEIEVGLQISDVVSAFKEAIRLAAAAENNSSSNQDGAALGWQRLLPRVLGYQCRERVLLDCSTLQVARVSQQQQQQQQQQEVEGLWMRLERSSGGELPLLLPGELLQWVALDCLFEAHEQQVLQCCREAVAAASAAAVAAANVEPVQQYAAVVTACNMLDDPICCGLLLRCRPETLQEWAVSSLLTIYGSSINSSSSCSVGASIVRAYLHCCFSRGLLAQGGLLAQLYTEQQHQQHQDRQRLLAASMYTALATTDATATQQQPGPSAAVRCMAAAEALQLLQEVQQERVSLIAAGACTPTCGSDLGSLFCSVVDEQQQHQQPQTLQQETELLQQIIFSLNTLQTVVKELQLPLIYWVALQQLQLQQCGQQQQQLWVTSLSSSDGLAGPLRFSLLPMPQLFRFAATADAPHLSLRALLLDLVLHLPAVLLQQQQQQTVGAAESVHAAAAALLSRLFLQASAAAGSCPTISMLQQMLPPAQQLAGSPVLLLLLRCCDFAWSGLPTLSNAATNAAAATGGTAVEVLQKGNMFVRCCLEVLHAVWREQQEQQELQQQQQEEQASLPGDLVLIATGWCQEAGFSYADAVEMYVHLLAEETLIEQTCDIFNAQLQQLQQQLQLQHQHQQVCGPVGLSQVRRHLQQVLLRLLLVWLKAADGVGPHSSSVYAVAHSEALDALLNHLCEPTDNTPQQQQLAESAKLVKVLLQSASAAKTPLEQQQQQQQQLLQLQRQQLLMLPHAYPDALGGATSGWMEGLMRE